MVLNPQFPWGLGNAASPCLNNGPPHCLFPLNSTSFEVSRRELWRAKVADLYFQRCLKPVNRKQRGVCGFILCHVFDKHHLGTFTEQTPQACLSSLGTIVKGQAVFCPRKGTTRKEPAMWSQIQAWHFCSLGSTILSMNVPFTQNLGLFFDKCRYSVFSRLCVLFLCITSAWFL